MNARAVETKPTACKSRSSLARFEPITVRHERFNGSAVIIRCDVTATDQDLYDSVAVDLYRSSQEERGKH